MEERGGGGQQQDEDGEGERRTENRRGVCGGWVDYKDALVNQDTGMTLNFI